MNPYYKLYIYFLGPIILTEIETLKAKLEKGARSSKRNNNLRATRVEIRPRCDELAKVVRPKDGRVSEDSSVKLRMEICLAK